MLKRLIVGRNFKQCKTDASNNRKVKYPLDFRPFINLVKYEFKKSTKSSADCFPNKLSNDKLLKIHFNVYRSKLQ